MPGIIAAFNQREARMMSAWIFKRKDTNNQDWYVVVSNGVTSWPLRHDLALGLARKLDDEELSKAFLAAREGWNEIAETDSAKLADMLASEKLQTKDVTWQFHKDAYPKVFLLDGTDSTYVVVPEDDEPKLEVGFDAAAATVKKMPKSGAESPGADPTGPRR